ncbi:hypothetical protein HZS_6235 [Henneguya salminicola]|nr:hypothetical protein HZS_6235 [Henneguya salminicola]
MALADKRILNFQAEEEKGENARISCFVGAIAIGDMMKTTLGPKGMDKILLRPGSSYPNSFSVTNDGATIMKAIGVDNPAAKVLVNIARVQDDEVGDGTTSVVVLATELLREAEKLVNSGIHPQTIIPFWHMAAAAAEKALNDMSFEMKLDEGPEVIERLKDLTKVTLSSKILDQERDHFCELAVKAVMRLRGSDHLDSIHIIKKAGGSLRDSFMDDGFILDKNFGINQPRKVVNARILVANTPMDYDKIKVFGSRVRVDSAAKVAELEAAEKEKMKDKVNMILKHDINVFINRQLIYNYPEQLFTDAGVVSIEHADFEGTERLAKVLGAEIVSTFAHPELVKIGTCKLIEEVMIGEDKVIRFSGVQAGEACTIVLRGASEQILDEAERALHDALCVLVTVVKEPKFVYGGGAAEMQMANAVLDLARHTLGKGSLAIEAFAIALQQLPHAISDNAGLDGSELTSQLRALHASGKSSYGLDINNETVGDMCSLKIVESLRVKSRVLTSAVEAAEMILRVDDIIKSAPRKREQKRH